MTPPSRATAVGIWRAGGGPVFATASGLLFVVLGVAAGRPLIVILGVPLLLNTVWTWLRCPFGSTNVAIGEVDYDREHKRVSAQLRLEPSSGAAMTRVRISAPGYQTTDVVIKTVESRSVELSARGMRTGRRHLFAGVLEEATLDRLFRSASHRVDPLEVVVLPSIRPLRQVPLPFRLQGLTGAHDSPRLGEGGDLHDVAPFRPGDTLRRIDWRVTARRVGQGRSAQMGLLTDLYVTRTHATADAVVVIVIDSRDDVGPDVATWAEPAGVHPEDATSLDVARSSAASLASSYLADGDRVGVVDMGRPWRQIRPAGGRRQLNRLIHQLAEMAPIGEPTRQIRAPQLPAGALVVVLSTFLDDQPMDMARMWRRAGHRVLAIDVLPDAYTDRLSRDELLAYRIVAMERSDRLQALERSGVELVPWEITMPDGDPSLATGLARAALMERRR